MCVEQNTEVLIST